MRVKRNYLEVRERCWVFLKWIKKLILKKWWKFRKILKLAEIREFIGELKNIKFIENNRWIVIEINLIIKFNKYFVEWESWNG